MTEEMKLLEKIYKQDEAKLILQTMNFVIENEPKYHLIKLIGLYLFERAFDTDFLLPKIQTTLIKMRDDLTKKVTDAEKR